MNKLYTFLVLWMITTPLLAQVANDICATAMDLGTLSLTNSECITSTTNGAIAELPYINQGTCLAGNLAPKPAADVWFSFTANGNQLDINLSSERDTIAISLYEGICDSLIGRKCAVNYAGQILESFSPVSPGTTYYLQVSNGSRTGTGNFDLCLRNRDNLSSLCIINQTISLTPQPYLNTYPTGQKVNVCINVGGYQQNASDWFHGLVPKFGSAWDTSTLEVFPPEKCDIDNDGNWDWYDSVTGTSNTGVGTQGPGFFYDRAYSFSNPPQEVDGIPGNNYGDNSDLGVNGICNWNFCFSLATKNSCPIPDDQRDLSIEFLNFSDSETGAWEPFSSSPCTNDPNFVFKAVLASCCLEVNTFAPATNCLDSLGEEANLVQAIALGKPPFTYTWSTGFTETTNDSISTLPNPTVGETYFVEVTDDNNCSTISNIILLAREPDITLAPNEIVPSTCEAGNGIIRVDTEHGNPPYNFSIPSLGITQETNLFQNLVAGTYEVVVVDDLGCVASSVVTIPSNHLTGVIDEIILPSCFQDNGLIRVEALGGVEPFLYRFNEDNLQEDNVFTNVGIGTHTITIIDGEGCAANISTVVTNAETGLTGTVEILNNPSCSGVNDASVSVTAINGVAPYTYAVDSNEFTTDSILTDLGPCTYTIWIQDSDGCLYQTTITIPETPPLIIDLVEEVSIELGESFLLTPEVMGGIHSLTYQWTSNNPTETLACSGCLILTVSPEFSTIYTLVVTDENGCETIANVQVTVIIPKPVALIPTVFSPNGDGINDKLNIRTKYLETFTLAIYNRWGQEIYVMTKENNIPWDGTFKSRPITIGVYAYQFIGISTTGEQVQQNGNISLIR